MNYCGSTRRSNTPDLSVAQKLPRRVVTRESRDAAARVRSRAAHVQSFERAAVIAVTEHRTRGEELVETQRAMEDIAPDETEFALEVERRKRSPSDHAGAEIRGVAIHRIEHESRDLIFVVVPGTSARELRIGVLAEEARDVL